MTTPRTIAGQAALSAMRPHVKRVKRADADHRLAKPLLAPQEG
jgi:hypothetical protein